MYYFDPAIKNCSLFDNVRDGVVLHLTTDFVLVQSLGGITIQFGKFARKEYIPVAVETKIISIIKNRIFVIIFKQ
ncbi:unnamed protein product [Leptidea sinapis]|uniref:Uncharacterized protein n=1 Tax=Leptidea sinapis TaxID=189913 RepID=A0A5E4PSH1_9NEOP|nr:unnamed protein product [Leptidea sinapis]